MLAFLKEQRASGRNHIFEKPDPYALIDPVDPKWQGELPHTIVVAPGGRVIYRSEGAFEPLALRKADRRVLRALLPLRRGPVGIAR